MLGAILVFSLLPATALAVPTETVENAETFSFAAGKTTQVDIDNALGAGAIELTSEEVGGETVYTIKLLKNITMAAGQDFRINEYKVGGMSLPAVVLDLNGCTILSQSIGLITGGKLTIKDSAGGGGITYSTTNDKSSLVAISNTGELTIEGGTFTAQAGYAFTGYVAAVSTGAGATCHIKGGKFVSNSSAVLSTGETTVSGGTFEAPYGMYAKSADRVPGTITIPADSTAVVNATSFAFVIQRDSKTQVDGKIIAEGGAYTAQNTVGGVGKPDTANDVSITGGIYSAAPTGFTGEAAVAKIEKADGSGSKFAVGKASIEKAAADLAEGDIVTVQSGSVDLSNLPEKVRVKNDGSGIVTANGSNVPAGGAITVHTPGNWMYDETYHWRVCTAAGCGEVIDKARHSYVNGVCTVCGAKKPGSTTGSGDITTGSGIVSPTTPNVVIGAGNIWQRGSKDNLSFTTNAKQNDLLKVRVDGRDLSGANYEVKEDGRVIALKAAYLETLSVGKHALSIVYGGGTAQANFTIVAAQDAVTPPQTGACSNAMPWLLLLAAGVAFFGACSMKRKGHKAIIKQGYCEHPMSF